jgi:hypothetical protein
MLARYFKHYSLFLAIFFVTDLIGQEDSPRYYFTPDLTAIRQQLSTASRQENNTSTSTTLSLPDQNGVVSDFYTYDSPIISAEMQAAYPDFKTYTVVSVNNPNVSGRIFVSRFGIEGIIERGNSMIKIEPQRDNAPVHSVHRIGSFKGLTCLLDEKRSLPMEFGRALTTQNGGTRRTYDIAIVATGEFYTNANFGNNNATTAQAAVVSIINLVNIRWNKEMAIQLNIFGTPFIYTNPATDPFNPSGTNLVGEAAAAVNTNFPTGAYDLGHALNGMTSGGSGVAFVGATCSNTAVSGGGFVRAGGWSGGSNIDGLAVGIMTHEIGHMFGSPHTFNGTGFNCAGSQHPINTAYEIGSGTTIMSYAGLCQADNNIQGSPDLYFHSKSQELFLSYINASATACATSTASGNTPPTVNANPCSGTYTIPKLTPFSIRGSATETDAGQYLNYTWEQINEDGANVRPTQGFLGTTAGNSNLAPLFRSYPPTSFGNTRIFPTLPTILNNANVSTFEPLPNVARTLNFRLTARDNNATNGAYGYGDLAVTVSGTTGPLNVSVANTATTWAQSSSQTITWDVNSTNTLFANVDILLSLDGGYTFPITLVANTPNDGSQSITLGTYSTTLGRIKVRHAPNTCFEVFDINNANITISGSCTQNPNFVSPTSYITAQQGSTNLNLTMTNQVGLPFTSKTFTISGSSGNSPYNTAPAAPGPTTTCGSANFGDSRQQYSFRISEAGSYTFSLSANSFMAVYQNTFSSTAPCTNILGNTGWFNGANYSLTSSMTLNLTNTSITYIVVVYDSAGAAYSLGISGPGDVYEILPTPANYSFTFAAVNTSTNLVTAVSSTASFSTIAPGTYNVHGVYYYSGTSTPPGNVNPTNLVGQNLSSLIASGSCLSQSWNFREMKVDPAIYLVTAAGNTGTGTLRTVFASAPEGSTINFSSGINPTLTASMILDKSMTITGNSPLTTINLNFTGTSGLTISSGKTINLANIKVEQLSTASPVISNQGTLNTNNVEFKGNVLPVVNNTGTINVNGTSTTPTIIRKP